MYSKKKNVLSNCPFMEAVLTLSSRVLWCFVAGIRFNRLPSTKCYISCVRGYVDQLMFVYFQSYVTWQHLQKEKYETPALGVLELAWPVVTAVLIVRCHLVTTNVWFMMARWLSCMAFRNAYRSKTRTQLLRFMFFFMCNFYLINLGFFAIYSYLPILICW